VQQGLRLLFAGTPPFAAQHLQALIEDGRHELCAVLTQPDRPAGRNKRPRPSAVKALATAAGLPVLQPLTLREASAREQIAALGADAMVVVAYGLILPQAVLDLPRLGCINVHASLLPRWRGAAPVQRAIEAGDTRSGVTIMQMEAGLDTGPMLATASCAIDADTTAAGLFGLLAELGPALLLEVLADLPAHLERAQPQDSALATYAAKIDKAEALIDWGAPAATLQRRIHAFNPEPGCYSFLGAERVRILQAECMEHGSPDAAPGTLLRGSEAGLEVACGEGSLRLLTLQLPGGKAQPYAALRRGHGQRFSTGLRFTTEPA
jgi:methionyl-tRNA formyltransferase